MKTAIWQRDHIRLTVRIVQTGPTQFYIPLQYPPGTLIPVDGSLEDAQRMGDAVSGCESSCDCPTWVACENGQQFAPTGGTSMTFSGERGSRSDR